MDSETLATVIGGGGLGGVVIELVRRWAKASNAAKITIASMMKAVSDRQASDSSRLVDAVLNQARREAELSAHIQELRLVIESAVDARQRDSDGLAIEVRELQQRVEQLSEKLANYDEFKRQVVYRSR